MAEVFFQRHNGDSFHEDHDIFFPPHFHQEAELFVLLEGSVSLRLDGRRMALRAGQAAMVLPFSIHSYESPGPSRFLISLADCLDIAPALSGMGCAAPVVEVSELGPAFTLLTGLLAQENPKGAEPARPQRFRGMLMAVYDMVAQKLDLRPAGPDARSDTIHRVVDFVTANCREPLTLELVAREVGVNHYHLSKLFSRKLGTSFPAYLAGLRVSKAADMLKTTDLSVGEIGPLCGFTSQSSFFRSFRALTGSSPLQYRKGKERDSKH